MNAKITIKGKDGQTHTWIFNPWPHMCDKFTPGDKIKILFNDVKIRDGLFDKADNTFLYVRPDTSAAPVAYPLSSITGIHKP